MVVTHLLNQKNGTPVSIVEDRNHDTGLLFQQTTDVTTSPVYFIGPDAIFIDGFESGDSTAWSDTAG